MNKYQKEFLTGIGLILYAVTVIVCVLTAMTGFKAAGFLAVGLIIAGICAGYKSLGD